MQFEAAGKVNNWKMVIALCGPAFVLLHKLPVADRRNYEKLTAASELHFGEHYLQQLFRTLVGTCTEQVGETGRF